MPAKPSVLLLPPRFTDERIWGGMFRLLETRFDVVSCDWPSSPGGPGITETVQRILPGSGRFDVAVAAQEAAGLAVHLAAAGLAGKVALFQPAVDSVSVLREAGPLDLSQLDERVRLFLPLASAVHESPERWRDQLVTAMHGMYAAHLGSAELALVCQVAADHAAEMQEEMTRMFAPGGEFAPGGPDGPGDGSQHRPWTDELRHVEVPVTVVVSQVWQAVGAVLTERAPRGTLLVAQSQTGSLWLEDPETCLGAVVDLLERQ